VLLVFVQVSKEGVVDELDRHVGWNLQLVRLVVQVWQIDEKSQLRGKFGRKSLQALVLRPVRCLSSESIQMATHGASIQ